MIGRRQGGSGTLNVCYYVGKLLVSRLISRLELYDNLAVQVKFWHDVKEKGEATTARAMAMWKDILDF